MGGRLQAWRLGASCLGLGLVGLLALLTQGGCTRHWFRTHADKEVFDAIAEKDVYPFWKVNNFHVYPDPRARHADPSNPDRPLMPPDDPAAHNLAPNPQKPYKAGIGRYEGHGYLEFLAAWDKANRERRLLEQRDKDADTFDVARRLYSAEFGSGPAGLRLAKEQASEEPVCPPYLITLEQAAHLALLNSREFQDRREDLYLTALPVTLQRFAFAAQFFATGEAIRERLGPKYPGGPANRWNLNTTGGFTKLFSTGALLAFQFANETVLNLTGNGPHTTSISTINLDFVQPLLRGGGRAVNLEPLTQAERNLVYEIRDYARFRKEFFVYIAGDGTLGAGTPGVGPGGFGGALALASGLGTVGGGLQVGPGSAGRVLLTSGPAAPDQGYLPTLRIAAQLVNEEKNVQALELNLEKFIAFEEGGTIDQLQVNRVETTTLGSRNRVLTLRRDLRQALDALKIQMGVPANVPLELDDGPIRPLTEHLRRFEVLFAQSKAAVEAATGLSDSERPQALRGQLRQLLTGHPLVKGTKFAGGIGQEWQAWERLADAELDRKLLSLDLERKRLDKRKTDLELKQDKADAADERRLGQLEEELALGGLEKLLRDYARAPWQAQPEPILRQGEYSKAFLLVVDAYSRVMNRARLERLRGLQESWPDLPAVIVGDTDLIENELNCALDVGVKTAMDYRLDLMNVRGLVVDAWRQVAVYANALLGVFNVRYHLDSQSPPRTAQPLAFSNDRSRHQLILNGELPLVRKLERNNYRAALIGYQRARRALMATEDLIAFTVRNEIRDLRLLAQQYKINQRSVDLAYPQVEAAEQSLFGAPNPEQQSLGNANAAALTQQYLQAQSTLVQARNSIYNTWIDFQLARLRLYRDLEQMTIDARGVWIDELANCPRQPDRGGDDTAGRPQSDVEPGRQPERLPAPAAAPTARLGAPR